MLTASTDEVWKDVCGYEGLYQVSNCGRVKRLRHTDKRGHTYTERIVKCGDGGRGYRRVHLSKNNDCKWYFVHRLVAYAFVTRTDGLNVVNHIDNNPSNNNASNLEWTDCKGNMQHASRQGRMHYQPQNLLKAQESRKRPVVAERGNEILRFDCARDAEKMGFSHQHIISCCQGKHGYKTHKGYVWRYA